MVDASKPNGSVRQANGCIEPMRSLPKKVAIVLAGAGARGAYEAGYIATLLPKLQPRPTIFVGTSAGAINAALLAANAHRPPEAAAEAIMQSWSHLRFERVLGPLWKSVPRALLKYAIAIAFGREPPESLADTRPLQASLGAPDLLSWQDVRANLAAGSVDALAFVATETGSGRSKVFYQTKPGWVARRKSVLCACAASNNGSVRSDETQAIDYVATALGPEHVRASAAIPVLFPPVRLEVGKRASYFIDGGVRLNAPLKPALQLGAEGLVVVSTDPRHFGSRHVVEPKPPSMQGQVLQALRALFADRMIEDIRVLLHRNRKAREAGQTAGANNNAASAPAHDRPGYPPNDDREIPIIFGGPDDQDRVGGVAARAVEELLRGFPALRFFKNIDVALLKLLTSVSSTSGPDLISYILFEPKFIEGAIRAGVQDASTLLNDYPQPEDLWHALQDRDERRSRRHACDPAGTATVPVAAQPSA